MKNIALSALLALIGMFVFLAIAEQFVPPLSTYEGLKKSDRPVL